jgi:hypothetical protein
LPTIVVGYAGGLCDQLQDGLACFVELIVARDGAVSCSCEWNDVWILSELTVHRTPLHADAANLTAKTAPVANKPRPRDPLFGDVTHQQL